MHSQPKGIKQKYEWGCTLRSGGKAKRHETRAVCTVMYFGHTISSSFCDKSLNTNGGTETLVLQIIFHGMCEMKGLHDQYLFKKSVLLKYLNMFQNTGQLLVYCRISSSVAGLYLGYVSQLGYFSVNKTM